MKTRRRQHSLLRDFLNGMNIRLEHQVELDKMGLFNLCKMFSGKFCYTSRKISVDSQIRKRARTVY